MLAHVRKFHSKQFAIFECLECGKKYTKMANLTAHYLSRHSDKLEPKEEDCIKLIKNTKKRQQERSQKKRKIIRPTIACDVCGQRFAGRFNLNRHIGRKHMETS